MLWRLVEITGVSGSSDDPDTYWYNLPGGRDTTDDPEKAEVTAQVSMKSDGCSHWDFPEQIHLCGRRRARNLTDAIHRVFDTSALLLSFWQDND